MKSLESRYGKAWKKDEAGRCGTWCKPILSVSPQLIPKACFRFDDLRGPAPTFFEGVPPLTSLSLPEIPRSAATLSGGWAQAENI